ncbi:transcription intermediary factor 1-alpha isoform X2 [Danio aesculapii]|uniref:transcription intermediary factor 1-alpha isoform X2 n=1 Tax=Danio aesculapii TaxID=1142201 RepID=UPI0024BF7A8E|nr:transcription intermediary factor 1-alpha isoform X2 [Danio aesculapii]
MFTTDPTGRPASPRPDLQKAVCGTCAACKGHLNDSTEPKLLPCLHTVCNICLTKICTDGSSQDCPSCAQSFGLSEVTECAIFEDLSDNNKALKCGGCEVNEVSGWCVQCEEALCLDCVTAHHRVKVTRDHEVTPKKPPAGWIQRRRCPLHSQESLRFFCLVCEELTCKDCQLITHRGHSFVHQEEAVESQKQQLHSLLDSIRHQKRTISNSLLLLEARLQDIEHVKMLTKTMLIQSVHKIYRSMVLKASQILKGIQAVYAEEVRVLLERRSSLSRLEGCQDYIADFIDKMQRTQGHCLLVYKKRIETQVKMLLSRETSAPETMIKLHIEFQKDLCQHILNFGFVRITKSFVPFTSERTQNIQSKPVSVESLNPNSVEGASNVDHALASSNVNEQVPGDPVASSPTVPNHQILQSILQLSPSNQATTQPQPNHGTLFQPDLSKVPISDPQSSCSSSPPSVQAQSHEVMSGQSKHAYSPSVHSQHHLPSSQQNKITYNSKTPKRRNTWTLHYYSGMPNQTIPRNIQTPALTHSIPASEKTTMRTLSNPTNNQIPSPVHPILAYNQTAKTTIPVYPIQGNNQIPITSNNQTPIPTHPIPASNQPLLLQQIPPNTQTTLLTHAVLVNDQTPIAPHKLTANDQTLVQTQPILAKKQTSVPTHAVPFHNQRKLLPQPITDNNKSPVLTHPLPNNNQTPVLMPPIQANNQAATLTHSVQFNNQTPVLTHPVSNIQSDVQTLIVAHPIQAGFLGAVHSFAAQPNVPLTILSTVNTLQLNDVTAVSNVHSTGTSNDGMNHCPTNSALNVTPSGSSLHAKPLCSDPISGSIRTNIPVKALADSACDQEAGVSSTSFSYTDHSESNLPTSTVSETDPRESSPPSPDLCFAVMDSLSTTTKKCLRQDKTGPSTTECDSGSKHWSADMPTTFRQLVETICTPVSSIDSRNATFPVGLTPCRTSEDITGKRASHDKAIQNSFDHSESEENEKESAATVKRFKTQLKEFRRSLCVSLVRLPVSLPPHGHPLPEFHLTTDSSTDHILVQESQGGEVKQVWRWHDGPVASRASSCSTSQMSDIDSSPASDVQFCVVCQSAGAALLCAKCGSAFHSDCHIPPIFTKPWEDWVCLLCQDVSETLVFDSGEEMKTTGLSLQDQRRCEKLLLGLQCDENMGLLYSVTKNHSKTAEFDIILGRLQGNRKPPYRTAAELVSDVWTVFDILFIRSEKKRLVVALQQSFQQRLNESFGTSLHASLLQHSSSTEAGETSLTDPQKQKHRNTLKRMREFFTTKCATAVKKSCNEKGKEDSTAAEH